MRRVVLKLSDDALAPLESEARRRGVPLDALLSEAIDDKAANIRSRIRPRVGIGHSSDGLAAGRGDR
jgi:hypothetical protein